VLIARTSVSISRSLISRIQYSSMCSVYFAMCGWRMIRGCWFSLLLFSKCSQRLSNAAKYFALNYADTLLFVYACSVLADWRLRRCLKLLWSSSCQEMMGGEVC